MDDIQRSHKTNMEQEQLETTLAHHGMMNDDDDCIGLRKQFIYNKINMLTTA